MESNGDALPRAHDHSSDGPRGPHGERRKKRRDVHLGDRLFYYTMRACGIAILILLGAIALQIFRLALPAIHQFGWHFMVGRNWDPVNEIFGAAPFIYGTIISSLLALLIACPVSIGVALFLNELAPQMLATVFGFLVEMLAAIPSVVYGLWGIFVLAPWLRTCIEPFLSKYFGNIPFIGALFHGAPFGVGMLAAGVTLAIMITPTISAICKEVFRSIPRNQREAALALGATRWETIRVSVLRSSYTGIFSAIILGLGRALGETMAVTMLIGNRSDISISLFAPGQTMASVIANEYAEATGNLHLSALAYIGLALFLVSFVVNSVARILVWHLQPKKEAH